MQKSITLLDKEISYTIKESVRARRLRLTIRPDGSIAVSVPRRVSEKIVEGFVLQKARWILRKLNYVRKRKERIPLDSVSGNYTQDKDRALSLVQERIEYFNSHYSFRFNTLRIKNQRTRWGSCSRRGALNFNYRIVLLPAHLADYIIVHELCHLKELNHSNAFWSLVSRFIPNHTQLRRELSDYSFAIQ